METINQFSQNLTWPIMALLSIFLLFVYKLITHFFNEWIMHYMHKAELTYNGRVITQDEASIILKEHEKCKSCIVNKVDQAFNDHLHNDPDLSLTTKSIPSSIVKESDLGKATQSKAQEEAEDNN